MDAVTASASAEEAVARARGELARAAELGAVRNDPIRHVIEAFHAGVTAIGQVLGETRELAADHRAGAPLRGAADAIARDMAAEIDRAVRWHARAVAWRQIAIAGAILGGIVLVTSGGGYWWGRSSAAASIQATGNGFAAFLQEDPAAADRWLHLMRMNDIDRALAACDKHGFVDKGRKACDLPVWIDGPAPAPRQ